MEIHQKKKYVKMRFKYKYLANIHLWSAALGSATGLGHLHGTGLNRTGQG